MKIGAALTADFSFVRARENKTDKLYLVDISRESLAINSRRIHYFEKLIKLNLNLKL